MGCGASTTAPTAAEEKPAAPVPIEVPKEPAKAAASPVTVPEESTVPTKDEAKEPEPLGVADQLRVEMLQKIEERARVKESLEASDAMRERIKARHGPSFARSPITPSLKEGHGRLLGPLVDNSQAARLNPNSNSLECWRRLASPLPPAGEHGEEIT